MTMQACFNRSKTHQGVLPQLPALEVRGGDTVRGNHETASDAMPVDHNPEGSGAQAPVTRSVRAILLRMVS